MNHAEAAIVYGERETWIDKMLHRVRPRKSFEQQLADALEAEQKLVDATKAAIRRQEFDLHMSLSRIKALNDWMRGRILKELP